MKRFSTAARILAAAAAILAAVTGCSRSDGSPEEFASVIKAYTGGVLGNGESIRIILQQPVDKEIADGLDEKTMARLFSFSPSIEGTARFSGPDGVEFIPEAGSVRPGTEYKASFRLSDIIDTGSAGCPDVFRFSFHSAIKAASLAAGKIVVKRGNPLAAEIRGNLTFSEEISTSDAAAMMSCSTEGITDGTEVEPVISVRQGKSAEEVDFTVSGLLRTSSDYRVRITFDGRGAGFGKKQTAEITVPAAGKFSVLGTSAVPGNSPYVEITFSEPLDGSIDPEGLIELQGCGRTFMKIEDNIARIYFEQLPDAGAWIEIASGLRSSSGQILGEPYRTKIEDIRPKPAVELLLKGNILPDASDLVLPFRAVNLAAVDISVIQIFSSNILMFLQDNDLGGNDDLRRSGRLISRQTVRLDSDPGKDLHKWQDFAVDLSGLFRKDPGAIYRIRISFRQEYSLYGETSGPYGTSSTAQGEPVPQKPGSGSTDHASGLVQLSGDSLTDEDKAVWDSPIPYYYESFYDWDSYNWQERDNPLDPTYYMESDRFPSCNLMTSDLGLIVKSAGTGRIWATVTDIVQAKPVKGASVTAYNYQLQEIGKGETGDDGFVQLDLSGKPFAVTAGKGKSVTYLKVTDGNEKPLSRFDVGGEKTESGIKAFIYGERGVWRPGDTLHLTMIVRNTGEALPDTHPVKMELYTPQGQFYCSLTDVSGKDGFHVFNIPTGQDDPTGTWNAYFKIGGSTFHKALMIETIKPNRLKISLGTDVPVLQGGSSARFDMSASWLSGPAASGLKAKLDMDLTLAGKTFPNYPGYTFSDPASSFAAQSVNLFERQLDSRGRTSAEVRLPQMEGAPGMLQARLVSRVQEGGGDESIMSQTMLFSPYEAYAGIKLPEEGGWIETDMTHSFPVIAVDKDGRPVSGHEMEYRIFRLDWSWWWESKAEELDSYVNGTAAQPFSSGTFTSSDKPYEIPFRIDYPDWGRFLVYVKDRTSGHATGGIILADWPSYRGRSDKRDPDALTMITFSTDKKEYRTGETATVFIPAADDALALVSLENGSKVISRDWVRTTSGGDTPYKFKVTEEMSPNFYIHITLLQKHGNTGNDLPVRMYGVEPVFVENLGSHLHPQISMPDAVRPLEEFTIKVSEKDRKKMTYTLAIVDEGLLDISSFKTPDPWSWMYAREALGVKTWDIFDEVIGAFGGRFTPLTAIGGDQTISKESRKDNRFNPVVKFLGPFTLDRKENIHRITLPMYVGSVRVMLVAGHDGAYGNAEKTVPVKTPLMVLSTLPRVLAPGEEIALPVNVFATERGITSASVSVSAEGPAENLGKASMPVRFSEPGDTLVRFRLRTAGEGTLKVTVKAEGGGHTALETVSVPVRNPNPPVTSLRYAAVAPGESHTFSWQPFSAGGKGNAPGNGDTEGAELSIAGFPSIDFNSCFDFVTDYTHSCSEQISSRGITLLAISGLLSEENAAKVPQMVQALLSELYGRQLPDGGFCYWPGMTYADEWVSSMAGQFMSMAKDKGYEVNSGVLSAWKNFQKKCVRNWRESRSNDLGDLVQAYRLYTLALASDPQTGAMNRMKESTALSSQASWRLAAAYCLTGKKETARTMINGLKTDVQDYSFSTVTYGSSLRDQAMILETLILADDMAAAMTIAQEVADRFSGNSGYTTQTAAFTASAMGRLAAAAATGAIKVEISDGSKDVRTVEKAAASYSCALDSRSGKAQIRNLSDGTLYMNLSVRKAPQAEETVQPSASGIRIDVSWTDPDGNPADPSSLVQGTDFIAAVTVSDISGIRDYPGLALTFPVPSGWEIAGRASQQDAPYTYMDIRDDKVLIYFDLDKGSRKRFTIRLRAAYEGSFIMPAITCSMMYDPAVTASTGSGKAEVKR